MIRSDLIRLAQASGDVCLRNMNAATDVMRHRPWKHIWKVADGVAMGKGSPGEQGMEKRKAEPYQRHMQRFLKQHMSGNAVDNL